MYFTSEELHRFTAFTMVKKTRHSVVTLTEIGGIPTASKCFEDEAHRARYLLERDILLELNGKYRSPRLLAFDDDSRTLHIEWIGGDRLKEHMIQRQLGLSADEDYRRPETIERAREMFAADTSPETMHIKAQIFSIVRQLHQIGIIHGDIDARNFIVNPAGQVFIIDFSCARFARSIRDMGVDREALRKKLGIRWRVFSGAHRALFQRQFYQSCALPDGSLSPGDGQGSTLRKFSSLGIADLSGLSFMDIGCAEGEVCRMAHRLGATRVLGLDLDRGARSRGEEINRLHGLDTVHLRCGDAADPAALTDGEQIDVVTCFSVLHHLLPDKNRRDILGVVTDPDQREVGDTLIRLINGILGVTRLVFFLELPFRYLGHSEESLETGESFRDRIAPHIDGSVHSLGIWHANQQKARFVFRIEKPALTQEIADRLLIDHPVLSAWRRNVPVLSSQPSQERAMLRMGPGPLRRLIRRARTLIVKR